MNFSTANNDAPSGARINTTVTLLLDDFEPFGKLPWKVVTTVDSRAVSTSHHETLDKARGVAASLHEAWLEAHSDYPEYQELKAAEA